MRQSLSGECSRSPGLPGPFGNSTKGCPTSHLSRVAQTCCHINVPPRARELLLWLLGSPGRGRCCGAVVVRTTMKELGEGKAWAASTEGAQEDAALVQPTAACRAARPQASPRPRPLPGTAARLPRQPQPHGPQSGCHPGPQHAAALALAEFSACQLMGHPPPWPSASPSELIRRHQLPEATPNPSGPAQSARCSESQFTS